MNPRDVDAWDVDVDCRPAGLGF
jgi:hypothetical protein